MKVKEVVDTIIAGCNMTPLSETCDQLITGDWDSQVTGIASTFMATVDVIKDAIAKGANLIITHEPTYFTGADSIDWLHQDEVYLLKQQLIDENKINIWRFHDHMHRTRPDKIYVGLNQQLGWQSYVLPEDTHCYSIPTTTVQALSAFLKEKLAVKAVQIVGDPAAKVERVGFLVGGGSLGLGSDHMPMDLMRQHNLDVMICGEILEWTLCAYVRDASQLGLNKAMIVLGHNRTEEIGMAYLVEWLRSLLPGIPVWFSEAGEPFLYV